MGWWLCRRHTAESLPIKSKFRDKYVWIPAPPLQMIFAVVNAVFMFHFSFRYSVVFYSGIRWCPQYTAWRFQAKTWNELPWWISIFLQIKKGNTSFGISHKYLSFPTLALSKSGSRVESNTFLSACFQAPLHTYSVPIKV